MPPHDNVEEFRINEETKLRKKLSVLNEDNILKYFEDVNEILNELNEQKHALQAQETLRLENLQQAYKFCQSAKQKLQDMRNEVKHDVENHKKRETNILSYLKQTEPDLLNNITLYTTERERLEELQFAKMFDDKQQKIDDALLIQNFNMLLNLYREICVEHDKIPPRCEKDYRQRLEALDKKLIYELKNSLSAVFEKINFPFENVVNYSVVKTQLEASVNILRILNEIYKHSDQTDYTVADFVVEEFEKRFLFHFYGNKETNNVAKPEWFFSQVLTWISANSEYFETYIQMLFDEWGIKKFADEYFTECLVRCVMDKVRLMLSNRSFLSNRHQFAHLLDESISFSSEIYEMFGKNTDIPDIMSLFLKPNVLDEWVELERAAITIGVEQLLLDENAFESRLDTTTDVDTLMVPNFADTFTLLMESMSERYMSFRDSQLRCRFLKHQLMIVDEFLSRIAHILHEIESPWLHPYPQLMNAIWFIAIVLDEWSTNEAMIELNAIETDQPLSKGTFDESSDLYRHEWRKRLKVLLNSFREMLSLHITPYANENWFKMNHQKPCDVTATLDAFIKENLERVNWLQTNISEDSRLTVFRMINDEIWQCLIENVLEKTAFTSRGAEQMLYDIQQGLIPRLQNAFVPHRLFTNEESALKHFEVAKTAKCREIIASLRLLELPSPSAILLKDEILRIPESVVAEKLFEMKIDDIGRDKILQLFEQRCDMHKFI